MKMLQKKMISTSDIGDKELLYDSSMLEKDFKLEAKIPIIPKVTFLNRIYNGKPIALDTNEYTLDARFEIAKVANEIWPITIMEKLEKEIKKRDTAKKKGLFSRN